MFLDDNDRNRAQSLAAALDTQEGIRNAVQQETPSKAARLDQAIKRMWNVAQDIEQLSIMIGGEGPERAETGAGAINSIPTLQDVLDSGPDELGRIADEIQESLKNIRGQLFG